MKPAPLRRPIGAIAVGMACASLLLVPKTALATPSQPAQGPVPGHQSSVASRHSAGDNRGAIVSSTQVKSLDAGQARSLLQDAGFPATDVRYGLTAYQIVYRTVDAEGRPVTASGLVAFPRSTRDRLRPVLFAHGTTPSKADAPSTGTGDNYHQAAALSFAAAGYAVVAPDYLGLGAGPGRPAYLDTQTEVNASLDLFRAARAFAGQQGRTMRAETYVAGFSQGAHAALTVARAIQEGQAGAGTRLGAVAPISGAYDFRASELPAMLAGEVDPKLATLYIGYLLTSWNALHGLYHSPREIFQEPYAPIVDDLYDGTHSSLEIFQRMPATLPGLLNTRGMRMLQQPAGRFAAALHAYDSACTGWTPRAPVRMYYARGDREAVNANTVKCVAQFDHSGYAVPAVDLGPVDHTTSGAEGVVAAAHWFDSLEHKQ